jgi:hypothetical protein
VTWRKFIIGADPESAADEPEGTAVPFEGDACDDAGGADRWEEPLGFFDEELEAERASDYPLSAEGMSTGVPQANERDERTRARAEVRIMATVVAIVAPRRQPLFSW